MVKTRKVDWVDELQHLIETNSHMFFADFKGLTVEETEQLRRELYELDSRFCVVKNRLAQRAFREADASKGTDKNGDADAEEVELQDLDGVGPSKVEKIQDSGYESVSELSEASAEELEEISGVGPSLAGKIKESSQELLPGNGDSGVSGEVTSEVESVLSGNTAIVFSDAQVSRVAETVVDFQEEHEALSLKAGIVEGDFYSPDSIEDIAELPSRREMLTSLAVGLNSPIQKLAQYLKNPIVKFVNVLDQVKDQKEEQEE